MKAISHLMRLAIPGYLGDEQRLHMIEIHQLPGVELSTASYHLGILKDRERLASSRQGKNTLYYLRRENLSKLFRCVSGCACDDDKNMIQCPGSV